MTCFHGRSSIGSRRGRCETRVPSVSSPQGGDTGQLTYRHFGRRYLTLGPASSFEKDDAKRGFPAYRPSGRRYLTLILNIEQRILNIEVERPSHNIFTPVKHFRRPCKPVLSTNPPFVSK